MAHNMNNLQKVLEEGRLIRRSWLSYAEDGKQLLCLYTALLNDPNARPENCPAEVCPQWLAHLLPWINDVSSEEHWPSVVQRVARLAPKFAALPPETEWHVRALCVREAMRHTEDVDVLTVCERVAVLCETGAPDEAELKSAWEAARAAWAAARAAAVRALTTWATAAEAAEAAAEAATAAATATAAEAVWTTRAARAAEAAAWVATADRLIDQILDCIETA